ncbi:MAG: hypothetical protein EA358_05425 [Flavobacteriales bacterium]|nr:MAG: hypothetical protein EA358_05425 [Flavobacteriales bacterium]
MKNSHLILFFSVIALLACLTSCQKDDTSNPPLPDELPPITQTGEQTFGCLLNGEVWVPKHYSNSIVNPPVVLQASWDRWNGDIFSIIAYHRRKDDSSINETMAIYTFPDFIGDTAYFEYNETGRRVTYYYTPYKNGPFNVYRSIATNRSWVYLSRFDTINRIASGTFSIDLLNIEDNQDTISIREGRFDVRF